MPSDIKKGEKGTLNAGSCFCKNAHFAKEARSSEQALLPLSNQPLVVTTTAAMPPAGMPTA
jgi:hypothetical protein